MRGKIIASLPVLAVVVFLFASVAPSHLSATPAAPRGIFDDHVDVGTVLHPGSVEYDPSKQTYTLTGSGENMWFTADAFQFVWKKVSGDVTLTADISFPTTTGNPHKKAVLMLRQSLDPGSVYADVALHGVGMTALQYRDEKGALTREIQSNLSGPRRLRIAKRGDYVYIALAAAGGEPEVAGGWLRVPLQGDFYVGIGVCSHDKDVIETAVFSKVELTTPASTTAKPTLYSTLETVAADSGDRRVAYIAPEHFEAPNWSRDGSFFIFNSNGHILRLPVGGTRPELIDTGFAVRCNNDHGISPDATQLAISDQSQEDHHSLVYILPIGGGTPRRITKNSPSYWHGWSPDGKTLAFVGQRNDEFDIYTIPASGGEETRLTTAKGLDDGPEYSPDGNYHLLQLRAHRHHADMADAQRRQPAGAGHVGRIQQLVSAHLARRQVDGFSLVRPQCDRTSREQGRDPSPDVAERQEDQAVGQTLRRAGNDQRSFLVTRQQTAGLRELSADSG